MWRKAKAIQSNQRKYKKIKKIEGSLRKPKTILLWRESKLRYVTQTKGSVTHYDTI